MRLAHLIETLLGAADKHEIGAARRLPEELPTDEITVEPGPHQDLAFYGVGAIANQARVRIKVSQDPLRNP